MDADKSVLVVNLTPVRFTCGPTRQGRTGSIQVAWYPERSVAVITMVGVPVEEDLNDIEMKTRIVVIHLEYGGDASWLKSIVEVCSTQIVYQWVDWLTNPSSRKEVPNIDWPISVLPSTNKIMGVQTLASSNGQSQ